MRRRPVTWAWICAGLVACSLDFGGGDPCPLPGPGGAPLELRDPETLRCQTFSSPGECPDGCACPLDLAPVPTWGVCGSGCEDLDRATCMTTTGCRAALDYECYVTDLACPPEVAYVGCFPVDQSGPDDTGPCAGSDAWTCSKHDDCIALHAEQCSETTRDCWEQFIECVDEPVLPSR